MQKIVVAVSGWKGSGKDTVAEYLVKEHGYFRLAFADILKEMVAEQYNIPVDWCHDTALKEKPLTKYPVESKDKFGELIHNFMVKEFRSVDDEVPLSIWVDGEGETYGEIKNPDDEIEQYKRVYWTPRALCILEGSIKRSVNSSYWVQRVVDYIEKFTASSDYPRFVISDMRYRSEVNQLREAFNNNLITSERDLDEFKLDYSIDNRGTLNELQLGVDDLVAMAEMSVF